MAGARKRLGGGWVAVGFDVAVVGAKHKTDVIKGVMGRRTRRGKKRPRLLRHQEAVKHEAQKLK